MDRRSFFKGLFGATAIAVLPKPVLDKMVEEPTIIPPKLHETDKAGQVEQECPFDEHLPNHKEYGLVVYQGDRLIAISYDFNLECSPHYIDMASLDDQYSKYILRSKEYYINASKISWYGDPEEFLMSDQFLDCIITTPDIKIIGQVILTNVCTNMIAQGFINHECLFQVTGELTIE